MPALPGLPGEEDVNPNENLVRPKRGKGQQTFSADHKRDFPVTSASCLLQKAKLWKFSLEIFWSRWDIRGSEESLLNFKGRLQLGTHPHVQPPYAFNERVPPSYKIYLKNIVF